MDGIGGRRDGGDETLLGAIYPRFASLIPLLCRPVEHMSVFHSRFISSSETGLGLRLGLGMDEPGPGLETAVRWTNGAGVGWLVGTVLKRSRSVALSQAASVVEQDEGDANPG